MIVAALSSASKCVGIEIDDLRAEYATKLLSRFGSLLTYFCEFASFLCTSHNRTSVFSHAPKQTALSMLRSS